MAKVGRAQVTVDVRFTGEAALSATASRAFFAGLDLRAAEQARRDLPFWALVRRWRAGGRVWIARATVLRERAALRALVAGPR